MKGGTKSDIYLSSYRVLLGYHMPPSPPFSSFFFLSFQIQNLKKKGIKVLSYPFTTVYSYVLYVCTTYTISYIIGKKKKGKVFGFLDFNRSHQRGKVSKGYLLWFIISKARDKHTYIHTHTHTWEKWKKKKGSLLCVVLALGLYYVRNLQSSLQKPSSI